MVFGIKLLGNGNNSKVDIRSTWADLTDDDLEYIAGRKDNLVGRIQERYGIAKEDAQREVDAWADELEFDD